MKNDAPASSPPPRSLLVFLSDRCDLNCDYCHMRLNEGPATTLSLSSARRAFHEHLRRLPDAEASFIFLGGEPFLHFDLLVSMIEEIRSASRAASITVVTNGATSTAERLSRLRALDARVMLSLDGAAAINDRHRVLLGRPAASSLGAVLSRLGDADRAQFEISMTVCEDSAKELSSNVEHLRQAGFRRVKFNLNMFETWTEEGFRTLDASLRGFSRYLRALRAASPRSLEVPNLLGLRGGARDRSCPAGPHPYEDLVLGADGGYYVCYAPFARAFSEIGAFRIGDADGGVDWSSRNRLHASAQAAIHAAMGRPTHYRCPRETYYRALCLELDPAAAVRSFNRADDILGDALIALAEELSRSGR